LLNVNTKRLQTIPKAAEETGIAESLIRSWVLQGDLQTYPNLDPGNPELMIDVVALLDLKEGTESEGN
jgi:hypothetical protein